MTTTTFTTSRNTVSTPLAYTHDLLVHTKTALEVDDDFIDIDAEVTLAQGDHIITLDFGAFGRLVDGSDFPKAFNQSLQAIDVILDNLGTVRTALVEHAEAAIPLAKAAEGTDGDN